MPNFSNIKKLDTCIKVTTLIFGLIVFLSAWNCDDAYHGFITVRNILNGNGFVYNIGERVNVCTCPLFVLILTGFTFIFREVTIVSYIICTAFSTAAFYIIASNFCKDKWQLLFTFFATTGSYCFMSFTTSGLENSLLFFSCAYKSEEGEWITLADRDMASKIGKDKILSMLNSTKNMILKSLYYLLL